MYAPVHSAPRLSSLTIIIVVCATFWYLVLDRYTRFRREWYWDYIRIFHTSTGVTMVRAFMIGEAQKEASKEGDGQQDGIRVVVVRVMLSLAYWPC